MSRQQGSGGLGPAGYIPPGGSKRNDGGRLRTNKYRDVKPSEQRATSGQRREEIKRQQIVDGESDDRSVEEML